MKGFTGFKGFTKILVAGALGLALSIPGGAGTAAAASAPTVINISQGGTYTVQQLNALLQADIKVKTPSAAATSAFASQVVKLVNQQRAKAGLKTLKSNSKLTSVAMIKAKDMKNNHYFAHTSPILGTPFNLMKKHGIKYRYAGENIAMGQKTPAQVMKDWMNSKGHRANIMSKKYTSIGVAYYKGEWVQHFMG